MSTKELIQKCPYIVLFAENEEIKKKKQKNYSFLY